MARLQRCTRCQCCGCPSQAEYSLIGETTMRLCNCTSRKRIELKRFILCFPLDGWMRRLSPRSKECGVYANFGCAFLNGYFEVVRHAHRQCGQLFPQT